MKTLLVLAAVCLALCVVMPNADACGWVRVTRSYLVNRNGNWYRVIVISYHWVCPGKRDQIEDDTQGRVSSKTKKPAKAMIETFPHRFTTYDKDSDNKISFDEFRTTLGDVHDQKMLRKLFDATDKNGDNTITCNEFLQAKFDFSKRPVC